MRKTQELRLISFRALAAIARDVFEATIDDAEWSARIKDRIALCDFEYPRPNVITSAMRAVGHVVHRPLPILAQPPRREREPSPAPIQRDEAADLSSRLLRLMQRRGDVDDRMADVNLSHQISRPGKPARLSRPTPSFSSMSELASTFDPRLAQTGERNQ